VLLLGLRQDGPTFSAEQPDRETARCRPRMSPFDPTDSGQDWAAKDCLAR
jgi:hypothetical protein